MQHNAVLFRINLSIISFLRDPCLRKLVCMFSSSTLMFVLLGRWCQSYCWCWCKCVRCNNALSNYVHLDNISYKIMSIRTILHYVIVLCTLFYHEILSAERITYVRTLFYSLSNSRPFAYSRFDIKIMHFCIFLSKLLFLWRAKWYGTLSNKSNGKDIEFEYNFHIILTIFEPC